MKKTRKIFREINSCRITPQKLKNRVENFSELKFSGLAPENCKIRIPVEQDLGNSNFESF